MAVLRWEMRPTVRLTMNRHRLGRARDEKSLQSTGRAFQGEIWLCLKESFVVGGSYSVSLDPGIALSDAGNCGCEGVFP